MLVLFGRTKKKERSGKVIQPPSNNACQPLKHKQATIPEDLPDPAFWSFLFEENRPAKPSGIAQEVVLQPKVVEPPVVTTVDNAADDGCIFRWIDYCLCSPHNDKYNDDERNLVGTVIYVETPNNGSSKHDDIKKNPQKRPSVFNIFRKRKPLNETKNNATKEVLKENIKSFSSFSYSESGSGSESSESEEDYSSDDSSTVPPASLCKINIEKPKNQKQHSNVIRTMVNIAVPTKNKNTNKTVHTNTTGTTSKMSASLSQTSARRSSINSSQLSRSTVASSTNEPHKQNVEKVIPKRHSSAFVPFSVGSLSPR